MQQIRQKEYTIMYFVKIEIVTENTNDMTTETRINRKKKKKYSARPS